MSARPDRDEMSGLLETAMEALALPLLLHDEDNIVFVNAAGREILGAATRADIEGLSLDSFATPDLTPFTQERRAYLLRDRVAFTEVPIKMNTLDGRTVHLTVDARPVLFEGKTFGLVTVVRQTRDERS